jgi:translation elongation factor EF-Tu-like GTPase
VNGTGPDPVAARIAELQAKQAAREEKRDAEAKGHELARLELVDRFEEELGALGRAFALVDCGPIGRGWIVVKPPELAPHKRYQAALQRAVIKEQGIDTAEMHAYAATCIAHPAREEFNGLAAKHPGVVGRVVDAANYLATGRRDREEGKF